MHSFTVLSIIICHRLSYKVLIRKVINQWECLQLFVVNIMLCVY